MDKVWLDVNISERGEFTSLINKQFYSKDWIFRGQSNVEWNLTTTLYREFEKSNILNRIKTENIENAIINEFKSSYHLYSPLRVKESMEDNPKDATREKLELLSIMQHYGSPTRLLDWTMSPYVATFFALDGARSDSCVYALNTTLLEAYDAKRYKDFEKIKENCFSNDPKNTFVVKYVPELKNERLRKQQGLFLVPSVCHKTIDDILKEYGIKEGKLGNEMVAYKLVFKAANIEYYWRRLRQMNITHEMIYPGIDGFCKSLKLNLMDLIAEAK